MRPRGQLEVVVNGNTNVSDQALSRLDRALDQVFLIPWKRHLAWVSAAMILPACLWLICVCVYVCGAYAAMEVGTQSEEGPNSKYRVSEDLPTHAWR